MTRDGSKGARALYYMMFFVLGCAFWIAAKTGNFVMSVEVYGSAVDLPATYWAGSMVGFCTGYLVCLYINGRRRWTAPTRIFFGGCMSGYFAAFVLAAIPAASGDLMVIASGTFCVTALALVPFDIIDLRRRHVVRD